MWREGGVMAGHGNGVLYVLYHGDTCLGVGTPEQIECEFGIKKKLLKWYACPSVQRRNDGRGWISVREAGASRPLP